MIKKTRLFCCVAAAAAMLAAFPVWAQSGSRPLTPVGPPGGAPVVSPAPTATLGQPFDPYASGASTPAPNPVIVQPGAGYPATAFPQGPPVGFPAQPGGQFVQPTPPPGAAAGNPWFGGPAAGVPGPGYLRLVEQTGFSHAYLPGDDGPRELDINESDVWMTWNLFPNFLNSQQPLKVTPGAEVTFLGGPSGGGSSLPPRLYGFYLDFRWNPQLPRTPRLSGELNFRAGLYTDFDSTTSDSLRFTGTGLAVYHVDRNWKIKVGGHVLDRARFKFFPAGGLVWTSDDRTRIYNLVFPFPSVKKWWSTWGDTQVWCYARAEYGGGSWTISRDGPPLLGASEQIDINDIRIVGGWEFVKTNWTAFVEFGYVFDREIVYVTVPSDTTSLKDTLYVAAGFTF